ncbi:MAG: DsbA family protein [Pelagibacteraceae bacterium]|jgi:protein-disulfide isomerase|nr:DsbA family protein [Pelagibacteraceae bacterium]MDP6784097.1 DsbA family protein [Alphaproteobacteria bacterium]MBO6467193.1 DsbA family protein [Pelagibacteraceae bacterium]MBO6468895.1 DsbA family protein [Pelagibacteraceae bacterium]MBO6470582.1 DsbA family protein [Pelagibacteraceae bacterium]|tara:strand:+ start:141 stop:773 length:633 start_codon:yes stop_codon:yes gene_type:complete
MKKYILNNLFSCFFGFFLIFSSLASAESVESVLDVTEEDFIIGDENAPITIIEYASLSCSHCADFHINKLPELIKEFVDTGKAKIVFRDFPFNYPALLGSMALRCVPRDIRYEYSNALYQLQSKWVFRENAKTTQELYKIMQSGGMTKERFNECIDNADLENEILQGVMASQSEFNIKSTPSFLVNGILIEGSKPIKDFRQIIDKILSEQ